MKKPTKTRKPPCGQEDMMAYTTDIVTCRVEVGTRTSNTVINVWQQKHRKRSVESKRNRSNLFASQSKNWRVAKPIRARTLWIVTPRGKSQQSARAQTGPSCGISHWRSSEARHHTKIALPSRQRARRKWTVETIFKGGNGESWGGTGVIAKEPDDTAGTLGGACSLVEEAGKSVCASLYRAKNWSRWQSVLVKGNLLWKTIRPSRASRWQHRK